MKVIDASVVVGWLLGQGTTPASALLLEQHVNGEQPLVAPELLHYEVSNAMVSGARLPAVAARQAYQRFEALEIRTYSLGPSEYDAAIALAAAHRVTVYDAAYAALAGALGCRLATADRLLARALAGLNLVDLA